WCARSGRQPGRRMQSPPLRRAPPKVPSPCLPPNSSSSTVRPETAESRDFAYQASCKGDGDERQLVDTRQGGEPDRAVRKGPAPWLSSTSIRTAWTPT